MIWFNIKELENLLIEGKVSDKLAFNYLLTHSIFLTITSYFSDDGSLWAVWVHLMISLIAVIWGVMKTFDINQKGGNRDYFKRFLSLSFVVGIRTVVFTFCLIFMVVVIMSITEVAGISVDVSTFQKEVLELIAYLFIIGMFYHMLLGSFRRINSADVSQSQVKEA